MYSAERPAVVRRGVNRGTVRVKATKPGNEADEARTLLSPRLPQRGPREGHRWKRGSSIWSGETTNFLMRVIVGKADGLVGYVVDEPISAATPKRCTSRRKVVSQGAQGGD